MSTAATVFTIYLLVGLLTLVVAVATPGKERRAPFLDARDGTSMGAAYLLLMSILWPLWLLLWLFREDDKPKY